MQVWPRYGGTAGLGQALPRQILADCFQLLHFHIGSQVPDIFTVKKAVQEARYYAKLYKMGFPIRWFDGGGLGATTTAAGQRVTVQKTTPCRSTPMTLCTTLPRSATAKACRTLKLSARVGGR